MDIVTYALCKGHTDKAVDDIMDIIASMEKLTMTIVDELPSVDDAEPNVIYLIDTNHDNVYEEYVLIEIGGEKELVSLGDITDLSNYYNKIETDNLLAGKQATLTWDNAPTENSTNAVNSGVVYAAVQSVANTLANLNCVMSVTSQNNVITVTYRNGTSSTITITAGIIPYNNTSSGLVATNVQSAIDEVVGKVESGHINITQAEYDVLTPAEKNNGSIYFITDADAEGDFSELEDRVGDLETSNQSAVHYKGTTTTAISNGSTTNPITIDGESYTAVFGDIVVYNYTEFVFDGTTWSEFGRPFDTTPTSGSANAVTSNGIATVVKKGTKSNSVVLGNNSTASGSSSVSAGDHAVASGNNSAAFNVVATASGAQSFAANYHSTASGLNSTAFGNYTSANQANMTAIGKYNAPRTGDLFNIGNGSSNNDRSNIVEVNNTSMNVNGDIKKNGVSLPTPYTTMPTITESMLRQIAMYVGTTDANYTQGWFYIASSDGAAEPSYSWVPLPTQNGYSETVLYTASSPHTNNIELSQAYTNFDDIVVVWAYSGASGGEYHNRFQQAFKTSALVADDSIIVGEATSGGDFTAYTVVDTTHINFTEKRGSYYNWISKVIGIKYGSNGGAVSNPVRSLAKSEEKPIEEEPTDEMR